MNNIILLYHTSNADRMDYSINRTYSNVLCYEFIYYHHISTCTYSRRAIHEINTTANFAMNSKFLSRILGGLNFQIEHHLFPKVSHIHYPNISHIVQKVCKKYDVKYNAYTTFFHAIKSHIKFIRKMWYTD
jgi:fatty acid desaturase